MNIYIYQLRLYTKYYVPKEYNELWKKFCSELSNNSESLEKLIKDWIEKYKLLTDKNILYIDNINKGIGYNISKQLVFKSINEDDIIIDIYDLNINDIWTAEELEDLSDSIILTIRDNIGFEVSNNYDVIGKK